MNMKAFVFIIPLLFVFACSAKVLPAEVESKRKLVKVSTAKELKDALTNARPGDSVVLADGVYEGKFVLNQSGTEARPITISGSRNAVLDAGSISTGYVLSIKASYCRIKGITLRNGLKGIVTDEANYNLIEGVLITNVGEEGIHFRTFSSNNIFQNSEITHTGKNRPGIGEAVYIGSAYSNWEKYTGGKPDKSDFNKILNNTIGPFVTAECIDIKEGTTGGVIYGNTFNSEGISAENSADSWIDLKGNNYIIENNTGFNPAGSLLADGYQVNCTYEGWGNNNVFKNNKSEVNAPGYAINVKLKSSRGEVTGTVVYSDNTGVGAVKGISNINLTPTK